jgi:hypothetical protein
MFPYVLILGIILFRSFAFAVRNGKTMSRMKSIIPKSCGVQVGGIFSGEKSSIPSFNGITYIRGPLRGYCL